MALSNLPAKYPKTFTFLCVAVISFPQWFQAIWSLFSTDAPIPAILKLLENHKLSFSIPYFSPYYITIPIGIGMFAWLAYELRFHRRNMAPIGNDSAHGHIASQEVIPDWPIRELFFHIRPILKYGQLDDTHEKVAVEILDKGSSLAIWGRPVGSDGKRPLVPIDRGYWMHADFTFMFLGREANSNETIRTRVREGHAQAVSNLYRDLHVNRAQAQSLWPIAGETDSRISMCYAMTYAYQELRSVESIWADLSDRESTPEGKLDYLAIVFGRSHPVWGIFPPAIQMERIPEIDLTLGQFGGGAEWFKHGKNKWTALMVNVRDIEKDIEELKTHSVLTPKTIV